MSGEGSPTAQYQAEPFDCSDLRVAVVAASWHDQVMDGLLAGAQRALDDFRVATRRGRPRARAPSSCRSSPTRWPPRATTPWWRSAS